MKSIEKVVDCLNEAFKRDPEAIQTLFTTWTFCNRELLNHPTVICGKTGYIQDEDQRWSVTNLGIINGIMAVLDLPKVAIIYDINTRTNKRTIKGFTTYSK